jgi:error-prone DNA polymerase
MVQGIGEAEREAIEAAIARGPFASALEFVEAGLDAGVSRHALEVLAAANALPGKDRRGALWAVMGRARGAPGPLAEGDESPEPRARFRPLAAGEAIGMELMTTGVSVGKHPMQLVREALERKGVLKAVEVASRAAGEVVDVAGVVICRQRPPTAKGMLFFTLEDETGLTNLAAPPQTVARLRQPLTRAAALVVKGRVQREREAVTLLVLGARELRIGETYLKSRDFR